MPSAVTWTFARQIGAVRVLEFMIISMDVFSNFADGPKNRRVLRMTYSKHHLMSRCYWLRPQCWMCPRPISKSNIGQDARLGEAPLGFFWGTAVGRVGSWQVRDYRFWEAAKDRRGPVSRMLREWSSNKHYETFTSSYPTSNSQSNCSKHDSNIFLRPQLKLS